jgi:hypothetical protein
MADDPDHGSFTYPANPPSATLVEDDDLQEWGWPPYFNLQHQHERFPNLVPDRENIYPQLGDYKDDAKSVASEPDDAENVLDDLPNPLELPVPDHDETYTAGYRKYVDLGLNDYGRTANEGRDLDPRVCTTIPAPGLPAPQATPYGVPIQAIASGHRPHVEAPSLLIPSSQTAINSSSSAYDARTSQPSNWSCKSHPELLFLTAAESKYVIT